MSAKLFPFGTQLYSSVRSVQPTALFAIEIIHSTICIIHGSNKTIYISVQHIVFLYRSLTVLADVLRKVNSNQCPCGRWETAADRVHNFRIKLKYKTRVFDSLLLFCLYLSFIRYRRYIVFLNFIFIARVGAIHARSRKDLDCMRCWNTI